MPHQAPARGAEDRPPGQRGPQNPKKPARQPQQARPAQTAPAAMPPRKPVPLFLKLGIQGTIDTVNSRVDQIVFAHRREFGFDPPPGLAFDLLRSNAPDELIPRIFDGQHAPLATGAVHKDLQQNPQDYLHRRPDGLLQPHNHFYNNVLQEQPLANLLPRAPELQPHEQVKLLSKYPMIPMGYIPIKGFKEFSHVLSQIDRASKPSNVPSDYGGGLGPVPNPEQQAQMRAMNVKVLRDQSVSTVKAAQQHMIAQAPQYFGKLPADGNFGDTWVRAVVAYQHSRAWITDSLKQLAKDNYLPVPAFVRAWHAKESFVAKHAFLSQFAQSIPLTFWASGHPGGIAHDVERYFGAGASGWDLPSRALNAFVQSGKLAVGVVGGAVNQLAADATAVNEYMQARYIQGESLQTAVKKASDEARRSPTIMNLVAPAAMENAPEWVKAADQLGTTAVLLASGRFTGVTVESSDLAGLMNHPWFKSGTLMAHNGLRRGEPLGVAAKTLEGPGGEALMAWAEKHPDVGLAEFRAEAAKIYQGVSELTKDGIFRSLRSKGLATTGRTGVARKEFARAVGNYSRQFEEGVRKSGSAGTNTAVTFARGLANLGRTASPMGTREIFGAAGSRLSTEVYNWAQQQLGSTRIANELRDEAIRLKASEDIAGFSGLENKMRQLYAEKHPSWDGASIPGGPQFEPLIESDLPHELYFPSGALETRAEKVNHWLNSAGQKHRQVIVAGLPLIAGSLFFKHAVADTLRRVAADTNQIFGLSTAGKAARESLTAARKTSMALDRQAAVTEAAATQGEFRWAAGVGATDVKSFDTADHLDSAAHMKAAGAYLRRHLKDDAFLAFLGSSEANLGPLLRYVASNKAVRDGIVSAKVEYAQAVKEMHDAFGEGQLTLEGKTSRDIVHSQLSKDHAALVFRRYKEIDDALRAAGLSMDRALATARESGVNADRALGDLIKNNGVNLPVHHGQIQYATKWDAVTQKWISTLMKPNKWNRGKLYNYLLHENLADLTRGGRISVADAFPAASDAALQQTVYHMLDFSNMLNVEQRFRWISYFATKHRLYWTWIAKYFLKHPLHAALVQDVNQELGTDQHGNINFEIAGHHFYFPLLRTLWVNSREYPEISPIVQYGVEAGKELAAGRGSAAFAGALTSLSATSGNVLTRDDQAFRSLVYLIRAEAGQRFTFESATAGMTPAEKHDFALRMVDYGLHHRHDGSLPSERDAVKAALAGGLINEVMRANEPLPIIPKEAKPDSIQKLQSEYDLLPHNKKRKFMEAHPELRNWWNIKDPDVYWHNFPLNAKFQSVTAATEAKKKALLEKIHSQDGHVTIADEKQIEQIKKDYGNALSDIKALDKQTWAGNANFPKDKPPWTTAFKGSPLAGNAFLHQMFGVTKDQLSEHTVTQRILALRAERDNLYKHIDNHTLGAIGYDQTKAFERLRAINEIVNPLRSYPTGTLDKAQRKYRDLVEQYRRQRRARSDKGQTLPQSEKDTYYTAFRAWRDAQDHPISVTVDGHKYVFPSPVQIGYAMLPGPTRQSAIAQLSGDDWMHLTHYELKLMGVTTPKNLSEAQTLYQDTLTQWHQNPQVGSVSKKDRIYLAKQVDKYYPGFYGFYLQAQRSKIQRFQVTTTYKGMDPAVKSQLEQYVFAPARGYAAAITANGHKSYYEKYWRQYIREQITPWLKQNPLLAHEVGMFGPDFLNTLVGGQ